MLLYKSGCSHYYKMLQNSSILRNKHNGWINFFFNHFKLWLVNILNDEYKTSLVSNHVVASLLTPFKLYNSNCEWRIKWIVKKKLIIKESSSN